MLGITTRSTLVELSSEWKIDGGSRRVMSHGKGRLLTMMWKRDVRRPRGSLVEEALGAKSNLGGSRAWQLEKNANESGVYVTPARRHGSTTCSTPDEVGYNIMSVYHRDCGNGNARSENEKSGVISARISVQTCDGVQEYLQAFCSSKMKVSVRRSQRMEDKKKTY